MTTNEFLKATINDQWEECAGKRYARPRPRVYCKDGFSISIQANSYVYAIPREDGLEEYEKVELGYPSAEGELILDYAENTEDPTDTVYAYVPVEIVDKLLEKHGGIDHYIF